MFVEMLKLLIVIAGVIFMMLYLGPVQAITALMITVGVLIILEVLSNQKIP